MKFPYNNFTYRLEDKKDKKICWFQYEDHLNQYVKRHKLKKNEYVAFTKSSQLLEPDPS